jgi:tRNA (mo5U34)-methyltransferase
VTVEWLERQIAAETYWFHRIALPGGVVTPGWSDPRTEKLPYFGLPENLTGLRVLDIGHAEGFFSFEAERRGAHEVIAIDNYPPMVRKFHICRMALNSRVQSLQTSVYDLHPATFGTFDLVLFYGVLYHLKHPLLALEKIHAVCSGTLLMQTAMCSNASDTPTAEFHPFGIDSGPPEDPHRDPTCFWFPNRACCIAMLAHAGYRRIEQLAPESPAGGIFRAEGAVHGKGAPPDERMAPWS